MAACMVVIALDVAKDFAAHGFPITQFMAVNPFDLERMEEAFGHRVVIASAGLAHALADACEA